MKRLSWRFALLIGLLLVGTYMAYGVVFPSATINVKLTIIAKSDGQEFQTSTVLKLSEQFFIDGQFEITRRIELEGEGALLLRSGHHPLTQIFAKNAGAGSGRIEATFDVILKALHEEHELTRSKSIFGSRLILPDFLVLVGKKIKLKGAPFLIAVVSDPSDIESVEIKHSAELVSSSEFGIESLAQFVEVTNDSFSCGNLVKQLPFLIGEVGSPHIRTPHPHWSEFFTGPITYSKSARSNSACL